MPKKPLLYIVLGTVVILSLVAGLAPASVWPHWRMVNVPLHSAVEALGALAAVIMALILVQKVRAEADWKSSALATGFLGMGALDGLHAVSVPGQGFVLLHSSAVLAGGIGFGLVWLPRLTKKREFGRLAPGLFAICCTVLGLWILLFSDTMPLMVMNGEFTRAARLINVIGGTLSLAAAVRFLLDFRLAGDTEDFVFSSLAIIFGLSGLTFNYSALWDELWWFWHAERLAGYVIVVGWVVSSHARSVRELGAALTAIQRAEEERDSFFHMLTHDLRSPLALIVGYAELISRDMPGLEFSDTVDGIKVACRRIAVLIDDMMVLSRLGSGGASLNLEPLSIMEIASEAVNDIRLQATEMELSVSVEVPDGMPVVYADRKQLMRVLTNLVSNAVSYNRAHGTVSVRAGLGARGKDRVFVEVADTGMGIPETELAHVFDKYFRGTRTSAKRGTGLGLAIVKAVAEAHGGSVSVSSREGEGSVFRVELPVGSRPEVPS